MAAVRELAVRELAVRELAIRDLPIRDLPLRDLPLRDLPLRDLPLRDLAAWAAPVSMAGEQRLPVLAALEPLFPSGGLRRGSVVAVDSAHSTSLTLALAAAASAGGSWCAAVGRPALGLVAAAEMGIVLERFALVPAPAAGSGPGGWAWVVSTMLDAFDLVLAWPPPSGRAVRPADARRLAGRARERGAVLVVAGSPGKGAPGKGAPGNGALGNGATAWPEAPDVRLAVTRSEWHGLEKGHGRLRGRLVEVESGGRGASARRRRAELWLPAVEGGVVAPVPAAPSTPTEMSDVG